MAFGIVEDGPSLAARARIRLVVQNAFRADASDGMIQIGDFEKKNSFVNGRIIFRAFAFEADETAAAIEFRVMARLFVGKRKTKAVAIKSASTVEIVEIEFDAGKARRRLFFA